jgi:hypothetical protein
MGALEDALNNIPVKGFPNGNLAGKKFACDILKAKDSPAPPEEDLERNKIASFRFATLCFIFESTSPGFELGSVGSTQLCVAPHEPSGSGETVLTGADTPPDAFGVACSSWAVPSLGIRASEQAKANNTLFIGIFPNRYNSWQIPKSPDRNPQFPNSK